MIDEKLLEKYYKGKLLCENYDYPIYLKILTTLHICTAEEIDPIDRTAWFGIIYGELEKVPPVEIDQSIYLIYNINSNVYPYKYYIAYGYVSSIR